jgi:hypothetical protein
MLDCGQRAWVLVPLLPSLLPVCALPPKVTLCSIDSSHDVNLRYIMVSDGWTFPPSVTLLTEANRETFTNFVMS